MKKIILVVILAIIVLGVGGYLVYSKVIKKNSGVLSTAKLNPDCKYNDPDLCKFLNGWKEVKYYTYTSNDTINGKKTTSILKTEGEDKSQMIVSEEGKENYNVISIANATYTKDYSDNKWWKVVSKPDDSTIKDEKEDELDFNAENQTTYKKIGTEACGKLTCFKYQVIEPNITDVQYIWFDNKQYQLRKIRIEGKDGSVSEATIDYSRVSITTPSPVKEGSPLQGNIPTFPTSSTPETTNSNSQTTEEQVPNDIPVDVPENDFVE